MTTATMTRPGPDGYPIPRVHMRPATPTPEFLATLERFARTKTLEEWAVFGVVIAIVFNIGVFTYLLSPVVGWWTALVDTTSVVLLLVFAYGLGRTVAPYLSRFSAWLDTRIHVVAWWLGYTHRSHSWLSPLPPYPIQGRIAIVPWHAGVERDSVIVRRVRIGRPITAVLFYDGGHVRAVGRVKDVWWGHPAGIAYAFGHRFGISRHAYRDYTTSHEKACAIELQTAWHVTQPFTLESIGVTGPVGSHRYVEVSSHA